MKDYKHIAINIEQDDTLDEVVARLNNICNNEPTLYCAEIAINLFTKKKNELIGESKPLFINKGGLQWAKLKHSFGKQKKYTICTSKKAKAQMLKLLQRE